MPPLREVSVGRAVAVGCFSDAGGGVYTTELPARVGGFTVLPRGVGDGLRIDTRAGTVKAIGKSEAVLDPAWGSLGLAA